MPELGSRVALLTSPPAEATSAEIAAAKAEIAVGTHALIQREGVVLPTSQSRSWTSSTASGSSSGRRSPRAARRMFCT